ncbi:gluconokinase [Trinickia dabaoshanensis]|uniref:Gluconokinase n=1 Tax=Trinickia dabaoshanensis TaxID=564714 RepID=A0A2N7VBN4_9BURK|nr:gluconokinase [Trinickia dabaoshanensis]PMS14581.1 gluconokinase [Trinickia dabaoshanensis]
MDQTVSAIVVMGVAGCGKSSVAHAVATRLGGRFIEGDAFHPAANVEKMRRGIGLADADRWGWLDRLAAELKQACERGERVVLACSALKRRYRERLRLGSPAAGFVFLDLPPEEAAKRVGTRTGHFMPDSLVASQFADLEAPVNESLTLTVDATRPLDAIVDEALDWHRHAALAQGYGSISKDSAVCIGSGRSNTGNRLAVAAAPPVRR